MVVHPDFVEQAKEYFNEFKVNIVTGQRFLGGSVLFDTAVEKWLHDKINSWPCLKAISSLTAASIDYPRAAFTSFTKSLQNEWSFVQRVLLGFESHFSMLKQAIQNDFLPTLVGFDLSELEI